MDYEVVGKPILIAMPVTFKLRMGISVTVTAPIPEALFTASVTGQQLSSCKAQLISRKHVSQCARKALGQPIKEHSQMTKLSRLLLCVLLAGLTTAWAVAQDSDSDAKSKGEVRTVTGCLTKSGSGNEYLLTGSDGSIWEVHANNSVDLASQVNHTVEAKGVVSHAKMHNMKEDEKNMAHDAGVKKDNTEHGHLKVTDVRSVSDSCQQ